MALNRLNVRSLRPALATLALAALVVLGGCGGGSGAPNNPYAPKPVPPGPVAILPAALTVYSGTPASLTITGGVPPYFVVTSNPSILPINAAETESVVVVLPANVVSNTAVLVTATDTLGGQAGAAVTVNPAPIFNTLTVTAASSACGTNTVCSGQSATAQVTVLGPGGAPIPGRQVRFDVVTGAFAIQSSDPATPLVSTLTVTADQFGKATAILEATVNAPTQPALLRATELTTGDQQTTAFTIVQTINGAAVLSVVPTTVTIMGGFIGQCSAGFRTDYYIYGGTPPYTVKSTFPDAVNVVGNPVLAAGSAFTAVTNGTCVMPLTFTIVDSAGLMTTALLNNVQGTTAPPAPPTPNPLAITPSSYMPSTACVPGVTTFTFIVSGGTTPYNVSSTVGTPSPQSFNTPGGTTTITWAGPAIGTASVVVVDSSSPQMSATASIGCT